MITQPFTVAFYALLGYLSGNVMYAYWIPRLLKGVDVREYGADGNPGASNAASACGLPMGILCAVADILKGAMPVYAAVHLGGLMGWELFPVVLAPVIGHAWPALLHFQGGKAIATSFGVLIGLMPEILLALCWAVLLIVMLPFIKDHSTLIIVTTLMTAGAAFILYPFLWLQAAQCGISSILVYKHLPKHREEEAPVLQAVEEEGTVPNRASGC